MFEHLPHAPVEAVKVVIGRDGVGPLVARHRLLSKQSSVIQSRLTSFDVPAIAMVPLLHNVPFIVLVLLFYYEPSLVPVLLLYYEPSL